MTLKSGSILLVSLTHIYVSHNLVSHITEKERCRFVSSEYKM